MRGRLGRIASGGRSRVRLRLRPVHGFAIAATALAAGGVALAAGGGQTIHACVNKHTRALTLAKGSHCGKGLRALSWNAQGPRGAQGNPGSPGLSASASDSESSNKTLSTSDTTLLTAHITTTAQSRIEASGGGTFSYNPTGTAAARLDCGLNIAPQGGSSAAMGNRTDEDFSGSVSYEEPGSAGGAAVEPAGSYTVTLTCNATPTGTATISFLRGDLNVFAAAP